jgi:acetylornithine deacetylase/succinyl-diaminopimelate desuccinylase family protein
MSPTDLHALINLRSRLEARLDGGEVVEVAAALIAVPSHRDVPGRETACAQRMAEIWRDWGFEPEVTPIVDGRCNVYVRLAGQGHGPALMLTGHLDTVPGYEMDRPAFEPAVADGKLWGRGAVDMKGALACMMVALKLVRDLGVPLPGDLLFAAVVGEEEQSEGTERLIRHGPGADWAVVGEPTGLAIHAGHRGLEWLSFEFSGRAAHGGTPERGVNAIRMAARFIQRVEAELVPELARRRHPLIGPAVMNWGVIRGGTQPSMVADRCVVQVDRRRLPSETLEQVWGEYQQILDVLAAEDPDFRCQMSRMAESMATMDHGGLEIALDHPLVTSLQAVLEAITGRPAQIGAFGGWTDGALLSNFGHIPTVIFGPGDLGVAHSRAEFVPVEELRLATLVYALLAYGHGIL